MKFAFCNEMFEERSLDLETLQLARALGYTGVEIAPFTLGPEIGAVTEEECQVISDRIVEAGLDCVGLHWLLAKTEGYYLTSPDPDVRKRTSDYLATLARVCRRLGGSVMVLGSPQQRNLLPGVSREQAMELAQEVIGAAVPTLEGEGVTLALEPLGPAEGDFLNTAEEGIQLAKMVASPNVRLHLDVKAMSSEAVPVPDVIRASAPWIAHFHANDPNLLGPGMGEVDFGPIFAALKAVDYDGWVSVEVFDFAPGAESICRQSMETMVAAWG